MSLNYTSNPHRVTITNSASIENLSTFTSLQWLYPTALAGADRFWAKGTGFIKGMTLQASGGPNIQCEVVRSGTDAIRNAVHGLSTNAWGFLAIRYSEANGIDVLIGDLTTPASELTGGTDTVGSGTTTNDSTTGLVIGNSQQSPFNKGWQGRMGFFSYHNAFLTDAEVITQQFRPFKRADTVILQHLGFNGTGTQPDWSGNGNSGAVTGISVVTAHMPLPPPWAFDEDAGNFNLAAAPTGQPFYIRDSYAMPDFLGNQQG